MSLATVIIDSNFDNNDNDNNSNSTEYPERSKAIAKLAD